MITIRRLIEKILGDWRGYLVGIILVVLATWLKYLAQPNIIPANVPILYFLAIVPTAIFFGFGPAILVCVLSLLAYDYFFIPPLNQISLDIFIAPILAIFLAVGVLFSYLASNLRRKNLIASEEITARKQTEAELIKYRDHLEDMVKQRTSELEQERNLLQTIMSSAGKSHLVYLDQDFNFIRVNTTYAKTCGYKPEEMIGKNHFALYPHKENEAIFARVRDTGIPEEYHDKPFEFPDQPERGITYWDWTLIPVKNEHGQMNGLVFSLTETTERNKAEEEIKSQRQLLETVVNNIPVQVNLIGGKDLRIKLVNKAYQEIAPGMQMIGKTLEELWPETKQNFSRLCRQVLETGGAYHVQDELNLISRSPGSLPEPRYFSWSLHRVDIPREDSPGILNISYETTQRKKYEEDLKRYNLELEAANKELEAFSYSVSHDLRAPLRTLDGFSEAVIHDYGDKLDETGKDYLNRVRKASQTMSHLIDDMLKLSRIIRAEMHRDRVNLSDVATSIASELRATQPDRQAEFIIAPELMVNGDVQLLQILMRNLMENSWKYTSKCPNTRIELGIVDQDGKEVYFIKDNGAGFNMLYADKLFQPFQRLHTNEDYPGTGIGLAIVQRVIARHGGKIWAKSEIGKGASFYFTLG